MRVTRDVLCNWNLIELKLCLICTHCHPKWDKVHVWERFIDAQEPLPIPDDRRGAVHKLYRNCIDCGSRSPRSHSWIRRTEPCFGP